MIWVWVVLITALLTFCIAMSFRRGYMKGRREGAEMVLGEWRQFVNEMEEE